MQDPYQQQNPQVVPVSSDEVYASEIQRDIVKNIISQISPDNQLYEIEMRIRGKRKDPNSGQWVKISESIEEPNEMLVGRYISFLSSILNQGTSLSNLSERQVNMIMARCIEWIADDLDNHAEQYDMEFNFTERTRIANMLINPLFMVLCRAIQGRESSRIFKAISLSEYNNNSEGGNKKKSFMDILKM